MSKLVLMRTELRAVLVALVLTVALPNLGWGHPTTSGGPIDDEEECLEPTPAEASVPGNPEDGVTLEVVILLDGPTVEQAEAVVDRAADAYLPLGIELVPRYEVVDFAPERTDGGEEISHYRRLVGDAKSHTAGRRPPDSDLVYVLTSKAIDGAAGFADCIGGVRYPHRAYAVGEFHEEEVLSLGLNFYVDRNAETLAHELGHLMGAHHHYANCAQGVGADDVTNREPAPCTLMFNFLDFTSINLSAINGAVVKGHAIAYAAETPSPEDVFDRTVSISLKGHLQARGAISTSGPTACRKAIGVWIQKLETGGMWRLVATVTTNPAGRYRTPLDDADGTYRAQIPVKELDGPKTRYCRQASSGAATHSH